jgi:hypothetical protein
MPSRWPMWLKSRAPTSSPSVLAPARHPVYGPRHVGSRPPPVGHLSPVVAALQAWRGVPCTGAVISVAAHGDLPRVDTPSARLPCVGLLPSESCTGERRRQGSLTKAGTTPARRALVEGA